MQEDTIPQPLSCTPHNCAAAQERPKSANLCVCVFCLLHTKRHAKCCKGECEPAKLWPTVEAAMGMRTSCSGAPPPASRTILALLVYMEQTQCGGSARPTTTDFMQAAGQHHNTQKEAGQHTLKTPAQGITCFQHTRCSTKAHSLNAHGRTSTHYPTYKPTPLEQDSRCPAKPIHPKAKALYLYVARSECGHTVKPKVHFMLHPLPPVRLLDKADTPTTPHSNIQPKIPLTGSRDTKTVRHNMQPVQCGCIGRLNE